ncbi:hypothetical protein Pcinc_015106 [Petrolisthes cinctipes]|uniref:Uncharacterized protein n=1 Tax=Petrolisthes cinctipes TaxID=88211 RepID=A0AAE1FTN1_PETCI|nr:hypothetical protein Pcinc_015106 [Petrolisthes cinctipes]
MEAHAAVTAVCLLNILSDSLTRASANIYWDSSTDARNCTTFTPRESEYHRLPYPAVSHKMEGDGDGGAVEVIEVELEHLLPPPPPSDWRLDMPFYHAGTVIGWVLFSSELGPKSALHWLGFRCWNDQPVLGPVQWGAASTSSTSSSTSSSFTSSSPSSSSSFSTLMMAFPDHWTSTSTLRNFTLQMWPSRFRVWEVEGVMMGKGGEEEERRKLVAEHNCSQAFPSFPPDDVQVLCYGHCGHLRQCWRAPVNHDKAIPTVTQTPPTAIQAPQTVTQQPSTVPQSPPIVTVAPTITAAASTSRAAPTINYNHNNNQRTTVVWAVMVLVVTGRTT